MIRALSRESDAQKLIGYELEAEADTFGLCHLDVGPQHLNTQGIVHGGILTVLMDTASGVTTRLSIDPATLPPVMTVSLTVNYLAPALIGRITARGKIIGGGRKMIFAEATLTNAAGDVLATSSGVFKRISPRPET
ncbi:PaaI family thioesterase [Profundibacter sp.]